MESKRGLNEMKNLKGKKKMKDHDFKNPRKSWSNLISLDFKEKVGGGWGYGEVIILLPLVLMCFALKRKYPKLERE